jgi:hypothetical protein
MTKHSRGGHVEALFFSISELENVGYEGPAYGVRHTTHTRSRHMQRAVLSGAC